MARIAVPQNVGKVRVAMGLGGKIMVWNGKQGKHEFAVAVRTRKEAEALVKLLNGRDRPKEIEIHG